MGRGRGFCSGGNVLGLVPAGSGLVVDLPVGGRADVAPDSEGRKRPFSSPPLYGVAESKRNRTLPSPEHLVDLEQDISSPPLIHCADGEY